MTITEAQYQRLCPLLIALCREYGHPLQIPPMEFLPLLAEAGIEINDGEKVDSTEEDGAYQTAGAMLLNFYAVFIHGDLPADGQSALEKVLGLIEQEVFETTGKYPKRPDSPAA